MTKTNLKQRLLDLPIEKKLRYSSIFITTIIILFLGAVFLITEYTRYKAEIESDLKNNSRIIAENISGALIFEDLTTANEILNTLKAKSNIIYAAVFNKENQLFTAYKVDKDYNFVYDQSDTIYWENNSVLIRTPVLQKGENLGNILLVYTQNEFKNYIDFLMILTFGSILISIFIANLLFRKIHHLMIKPLLYLTDAMQKVTHEKDFNIEIKNESPDEIGILSRGFNKMISQIKEDLDHRTTVEDELKNLAMFDQLTKLPNRHYFHEHLESTIKRHERKKEHFALLFLDLDGFKNINDTLGHDYGDLLLQEIASRLSGCIRESDFVARLGGDEFTIVLENVEKVEDIEHIADQIIYAISKEIDLDGTKAYVSGSIGISRYLIDSDCANLLMQYADLAMYHAKENGKNDFIFYNAALNIEKSRAYLIETELRSAIENEELSLNYQPKVDLKTNTVETMEVLLRWNSKKLGFVSPAEFIPIAEKSSLIIKLESWVIQTASLQVKTWNKIAKKDYRVAINISQMHFKQKSFLEDFNTIMQNSGVNLNHLEIELTESAFLSQTEENIQKLSYLQSLGIKISIDDFCTGYSSLSYLKKLPINSIKIDKSFIDGLPNDKDDVAITKTVIDLAKRFNLKTVAEGVETKDQVDLLKELGCDTIQGYYFFKPLSVEAFEQHFVVDKALLIQT